MGGYLAELTAANIYAVAVLIEKSLKPSSGNRRQIFGCQANRIESDKPDSNTEGKFFYLFPLKFVLNWRFYVGNLSRMSFFLIASFSLRAFLKTIEIVIFSILIVL